MKLAASTIAEVATNLLAPMPSKSKKYSSLEACILLAYVLSFSFWSARIELSASVIDKF